MSQKRVDSQRINAKGLIAQMMERQPERASNLHRSGVDDAIMESLVTTDLRENLPPQLLAVVAGVLKLVEGMDPDSVKQEANIEGQSSKGK